MPRKDESKAPGGQATLTESVTRQMTDDIVHSRLEPGSKLRIDELKRRYGMGASPLREALTRLLSQGFVTNESRRGFRVATVSHADIKEITEVRKLIELKALETSIRRGDHAWEERVVVEMARLRHTLRQAGGEARSLDPGADGVHEAYHRALISACGSPRLIDLQETYYDLAKRYRLLVFQQFTTQAEFLERHEVLTEVVLSRKVSASLEELRQHLDLLVLALPEDMVQ